MDKQDAEWSTSLRADVTPAKFASRVVFGEDDGMMTLRRNPSLGEHHAEKRCYDIQTETGGESLGKEDV